MLYCMTYKDKKATSSLKKMADIFLLLPTVLFLIFPFLISKGDVAGAKKGGTCEPTVSLPHSHRRMGRGGEGGCSPPKFWETHIFWAAREILGKASFLTRFRVF